MRYSIIIPCYNEKDNIDHLIKKITPLKKKYDLEYILVENGSQDRSKEYFEKNVDGKYPNIKVAYVKKNLGYGYGLQQGIKIASGDYIGWIHADLQMPPEKLCVFFDEIEKHKKEEKLFLKGIRTNRSTFDKFFTNGQSLINSILFGKKIYDVGAIPVVFHSSLIENKIDDMPNDFSIELYVYKEAAINNFKVIRYRVRLLKREKGNSSWNHGLKSKIKQSKIIFIDSLKIKRGEKVR